MASTTPIFSQIHVSMVIRDLHVNSSCLKLCGGSITRMYILKLGSAIMKWHIW